MIIKKMMPAIYRLEKGLLVGNDACFNLHVNLTSSMSMMAVIIISKNGNNNNNNSHNN